MNIKINFINNFSKLESTKFQQDSGRINSGTSIQWNITQQYKERWLLPQKDMGYS